MPKIDLSWFLGVDDKHKLHPLCFTCRYAMVSISKLSESGVNLYYAIAKTNQAELTDCWPILVTAAVRFPVDFFFVQDLGKIIKRLKNPSPWTKSDYQINPKNNYSKS